MVRFSRKIEYALLAMQYITVNNNRVTSAKEISENFNLSFEFLSKTLQSLMKNGLITSQQGIKGGYLLGKSPEEITVADVVFAIEGKTSIVDCFVKNEEDFICNRSSNCTIKNPMRKIQKKIEDIFSSTTIQEISHTANKNLKTA